MSPHRLAAQTMLWRALRTLVQCIAPMLPHLAEDVFREAPVLFSHESTFTHNEQSAKEFGSSIFHYGLQHPALYGEHAGRTFSPELAADIAESHSMVAGAAIRSMALDDAGRSRVFSCSGASHPFAGKCCNRTCSKRWARWVSVRDCADCEGTMRGRWQSSLHLLCILMRFKRRWPSKQTALSSSI